MAAQGAPDNLRPYPLWLALVAMPLAGVLITLSLAPFGWWPLALAGCTLTAQFLCACPPGTAFFRGWLLGLGLFGSGASWVWVSIHDYGYAPVWLATLLTALFCAGLALLPALFGWTYARWVRGLPGGMLLGFSALWVLFEWLRSWLLTGFPWLYLGYGFIDTWIAGWAPILGVFGMSFIVALTSSCLFLSWRSRQPVAVLTYIGIIATLWGGGAFLRPIEWVVPASEFPLSTAIYQPNISQHEKWRPENYRRLLTQYEVAVRPLYGHDIILWPEAAIPAPRDRAESFLQPIARRAEITDSTLITGIPTRNEQGEYFNSIIALGQGAGTYHKQRLVPFGEYVPLEDWLRGIIGFFDLPTSHMSAGEPGQTGLRAGSHRIAPYICYEIVYPDLVARGARNAELLVTVSNDAWFGASIGPLQHLQMARLRALENGRYLLRGTNNGVSAIIDHRGQVLTRSQQFVETTVVGDAMVMLGHTPFTSFGSLPVIVGCALALLLMTILYLTLWRGDH